jgi:hypothetical protein
MTTRTARLVEAASSLRRRIWASLPWRLRLAEFLSRLAVSPIETFGKVIYAEFLSNEVQGMPDIHGKPASEFDTSRKPLANRLPTGYGQDFGKKAYLMLMAKFHQPTMVEDILSSFMLRFIESGSKGIKPGSTLREAQNYVLVGVNREGLNYIRSQKRRQEVPDVYVSDEGEKPLDFGIFDEGPEANHLERILSRIAPQLRHIHPDAPLYVKLSLEGHTDREIIGDPKRGVPSMLSHPLSSQGKPLDDRFWNAVYKPKIFEVLKSEFKELPIAV